MVRQVAEIADRSRKTDRRSRDQPMPAGGAQKGCDGCDESMKSRRIAAPTRASPGDAALDRTWICSCSRERLPSARPQRPSGRALPGPWPLLADCNRDALLGPCAALFCPALPSILHPPPSTHPPPPPSAPRKLLLLAPLLATGLGNSPAERARPSAWRMQNAAKRD